MFANTQPQPEKSWALKVVSAKLKITFTSHWLSKQDEKKAALSGQLFFDVYH
jgi:hypothetical protein